MTTVYLARHATPDWSIRDIPYHLPPGPPLIPQGYEEAEKLGYFFKEKGVKKLFASPLLRCQTTAQIAAQVCGATIETIEEIREWQPEEDRIQVIARMRPVFEKISQLDSAYGPAAMVSHGGPISLLLTALGMDETQLESQLVFDHKNPVPPAGSWEVTGPGMGGTWQMNLVFEPAKFVLPEQIRY